MSATKLYTPQVLALTVELAEWPLIETLPLMGEARSPTCGSTLALTLSLDGDGRIERIGMRVRACAIGQAAAAIFARHATGLNQEALRRAHDELADWLQGGCASPDWPDLGLIAAARDYPARHGALLLPWKAALAALSSAPSGR